MGFMRTALDAQALPCGLEAKPEADTFQPFANGTKIPVLQR
jgi:hypothetical protein